MLAWNLNVIEKEAWLRGAFSGAIGFFTSYYLLEDRQYHAEINRAFCFERLEGQRKIIPNKLEALAVEKEDCINALFNRVAVQMYRFGRHVQVLKLKPGQEGNIVVSGRAYEYVTNDDPRHDHHSLDLIDFVRVTIDPNDLSIFERPYEQNHIHLWNG
ncbi:MAG: hypothetical protein GC137_00130 [Alphaproteobacteria bacterium]|nr:hypothetical protein [Alphaproteobacteria bacterium]